MLPRIFIVYDTEGTGLDLMRSEDLNIPCAISRRGDEVCQIGGIILDNGMIPQNSSVTTVTRYKLIVLTVLYRCMVYLKEKLDVIYWVSFYPKSCKNI